jgi:hypothetical protein
MIPWTVMPNCLDMGRFTIVGFGKDYMLVTTEDDCPGCISGGGIGAVERMLANINCIFVSLDGSCRNGLKGNHIWICGRDVNVFPETQTNWWETQRGKSLCPETFEEAKRLLLKD